MAEHHVGNTGPDKLFNPPGVHKPVSDDAQLIKAVKDALLAQTESAGIDVKVSAEDGNVRLTGVVDVLSHKRVAEEIVRRIPGVRRIENDICVANEETASDKDLIAAITNKLTRDGDSPDVGCRVHKGVVTLVGHAATYGDVRAAARLVEDMAGVREVRIERVKVGEGQEEDDADVARTAERLLDKLGYDHRLFQVYCDAGTLFVKGFVPRRDDKGRIKTAMHEIPGVAKLEATLIPEEQVAGELH